MNTTTIYCLLSVSVCLNLCLWVYSRNLKRLLRSVQFFVNRKIKIDAELNNHLQDFFKVIKESQDKLDEKSEGEDNDTGTMWG